MEFVERGALDTSVCEVLVLRKVIATEKASPA